MGTTLTGTQINNTYPGLIKTTDNTAVTGTLKALTDGDGNDLPIEVSSTGVNFTGTVTGIDGAGLVNGTGLASGYKAIKVADGLVNNPATATSGGNIAIGESADATGDNSFARHNIAIGSNSQANVENSLSLGNGARALSDRTVSIGNGATASSGRAISVGVNSTASGFSSVCVGGYSRATGESAVAIGGYDVRADGNFSRAIGRQVTAFATKSTVIGFSSSDADAARPNTVTIGNNINTAQYTVNIGNDQNAYGADGVCIGNNNFFSGDFNVVIGKSNSITSPTSNDSKQILIGYQDTSTIDRAGVIGHDLTSVWADGITMNQIALANVANLNFVDQTAAVAGGVPTGGVYHTDGALKIVY